MAKKEKVEKIDYKKEYAEIRDLLQRTQADFVNYKRRSEEDRVSFIKLASSDLIEQVLPVLDNFALAAKHVPDQIKQNQWVLGINAIEKQLEQVLMTNGLERVEVSGTEFDPNQHEALGEETDESKKDGEIIREESAGYMLNGKLIRPAKVIVNKVK